MSEVYLAKKDGRIIFHTDAAAMEQIDGVTTPDMTITTEEWEAAGGLARIIDGEIVIGKTADEKAAEETAAITAARVAELRRNLAETDYIAAKIAEGSATTEEYADKIAQRRAWRGEIAELEATA